MQEPDLIRIFTEPFEANAIPYFITGSIASIFYGEPRLTHDVDLVLHLAAKDVPRFTSLFLLETFYCPPEEVIKEELTKKPYGHFNLIHHRSGFKADCYTEANDSLHAWAFKNKKRVELGLDFSIWIAPPEYVIIRKLEYYREGGSDKHLEDIRKMLPQIKLNLQIDFLQTELSKRHLTEYATKIAGLI